MKLDDKYTLQSGSVYLTGMQALVRLPMDQMRRDQLADLNTATFISGYEGSPLGTYDLALSRAAGLLKDHRIHFVPGVNLPVASCFSRFRTSSSWIWRSGVQMALPLRFSDASIKSS